MTRRNKIPRRSSNALVVVRDESQLGWGGKDGTVLLHKYDQHRDDGSAQRYGGVLFKL
jgi:hypothetical protein